MVCSIRYWKVNATLAFFILLAIRSVVVFAEIYQWTDKQGQTHYSGIKQEHAKLLKINPGYAFFRVKKVYDGDTILLTNGTKVRLLGINTPEVETRNKSAQPLGEEAKQWLEKALLGKKVFLIKDSEKKDKYGRTLAYVFNEERRHINLELVEIGLATVNIHPPGLKYVDELLVAQDKAEAEKIGLWQHKQYQRKSIISIEGKRPKGWQRLFGEIVGIRESRKYVYLEFSKSLDARIARKHLLYFPDISIYLHKTIEVRGWLSRRKKHFSMLIRHPSAIKVMKSSDSS